MDNKFNNQLDLETVINISDSGYTNNQIGVDSLNILLSIQSLLLLLDIRCCCLIVQIHMS
jgi:hypothetical protein